MAEDDIQITIKEYISEDRYLNYPLVLRCTSEISIYTTEPFKWEGEYNGQKIYVILEKGDSADFAIIDGASGLNLNEKIRKEITRIIRKLN